MGWDEDYLYYLLWSINSFLYFLHRGKVKKNHKKKVTKTISKITAEQQIQRRILEQE